LCKVLSPFREDKGEKQWKKHDGYLSHTGNQQGILHVVVVNYGGLKKKRKKKNWS
jgi:hypothetical protein